jgi:hypothetical protein
MSSLESAIAILPKPLRRSLTNVVYFLALLQSNACECVKNYCPTLGCESRFHLHTHGSVEQNGLSKHFFPLIDEMDQGYKGMEYSHGSLVEKPEPVDFV